MTHEYAEHFAQLSAGVQRQPHFDGSIALVEYLWRDFGAQGLLVSSGETCAIHLGEMNPSRGLALLGPYVETLGRALWSPPCSGALERLGYS